MTIYKSLKKVGLLLAALALAGCASTSADARFLRIKGSASAPVNMVPPTQTGIPRENDTLTCVTNPSDWVFDGGTYTYQRYRDDASTPIGGATSAAYTAVTADVGHTVICRAGNTNIAGTGYGYSLASDIVASATLLLPATQTVSFGDKTLAGHGGDPLGYIGTSYVGVTGGTSGCGTIFSTDTENKLVPKNGSTAINGQGPTFPASCSVTIAEYTGRSGTDFRSYSYSGATGVTGSVTLSFVVNAYTVASRPSVDTSAATGHQIGVILGLTSAAAYRPNAGDQIIARDGNYYSTAAVSRTITKATTQWPVRSGGPAQPTSWRGIASNTQVYYGACSGCQGEGFVWLRAEHQFGAVFRKLTLTPSSSQPTNPWNLRISEFLFTPLQDGNSIDNGSSTKRGLEYTNSNLHMLLIDHNKFQGMIYPGETTMNPRNGTSAIIFSNSSLSTSDLHFYDNIFDNNYNDFAGSLANSDFMGNVSTQCWEDCASGALSYGARLWFNKMYYKRHAAPYLGGAAPHADYFQDSQSNTTREGSYFIGNLMLAGTSTGGQGYFYDDTGAPRGPGEVKGNIYADTYQNGVRCGNGTGAPYNYTGTTCHDYAIKYNTLVRQNGFQTGSGLPQIDIEQAINMDIGYNLVTASTSRPNDIGGLSTTGAALVYLQGPFPGTITTDLDTLIAAYQPTAAAISAGAGAAQFCNYTAATCQFPDGTSYIKPKELP